MFSSYFDTDPVHFQLPVHQITLNPQAPEWYPTEADSEKKDIPAGKPESKPKSPTFASLVSSASENPTSPPIRIARKRKGSSKSQQTWKGSGNNRGASSTTTRASNGGQQQTRRRQYENRKKQMKKHLRQWQQTEGKRIQAEKKEGRPTKRGAKRDRWKQKKYGYRSKQNKIDDVLNNLNVFLKQLMTRNGEKLRGRDTVRIDVKRFKSLQNIEGLLLKVMANDQINVVKADFPVSQKNRFQMKGFIAYIKCQTVEEAERLKRFVEVEGKGFRVKIALDKTSEQQTNPTMKSPSTNHIRSKSGSESGSESGGNN